jgi:hypothetical protein
MRGRARSLEEQAVATSNLGLGALAAGGCALAIGVIVGVVAGVRSFLGPGASGDGVAVAPPTQAAEIASAGMHARGTAELRELGCDQPVVMDMLRLLGDAGAMHEHDPRYMVTCDVSSASPPTCDRAAAVYFGAMAGTVDGDVAIRVGRIGTLAPVCSRLYAPNGIPLDR